MRVLLLCCVALLLAGCRQSDSPIPPPLVLSSQEDLIVDGFNGADQIVLGDQWFRVGGYYDFSPYGQVTITFTARREVDRQEADHVTLRIGPALYITTPIKAAEVNVSLQLFPRSLSKPRVIALTFINPDPETTVHLSSLRVIGRTPG